MEYKVRTGEETKMIVFTHPDQMGFPMVHANFTEVSVLREQLTKNVCRQQDAG